VGKIFFTRRSDWWGVRSCQQISQDRPEKYNENREKGMMKATCWKQ